MPEYLAPGVFVEETSFRSKSIEGVGTSVAGIVGPTRTGPMRGKPEVATSFGDFVRVYGDANDLVFGGTSVLNHTAIAARAFFENGGKQLFVARVVAGVNASATDGSGSSAASASRMDAEGDVTFRARFPGAVGNYVLELNWRDHDDLLRVEAVELETGKSAMLVGAVKGSDFAPPLPGAQAGRTVNVTGQVKRIAAGFQFGEESVGTLDDGTEVDLKDKVVGADAPGFQVVEGSLRTPVGGALAEETPAELRLREDVSGLQAVLEAKLVGLRLVGTLKTAASGATLSFKKAENPELSGNVTVAVSALAAIKDKVASLTVQRAFNLDVRVRRGTGETIDADDRNGEVFYSYAKCTPDRACLEKLMAATPERRSDALASPISCTVAADDELDVLTALRDMCDEAALSGDTVDKVAGPRYLIALTGGTDGAQPVAADYAGEVDPQKGPTGLSAFEDVEDISIVMTPAAALLDQTGHQGVVLELQKHVRKMRYRVGIVDSRKDQTLGEVRDWAGNFSDTRLALYYPWVRIADPTGVRAELVAPPGGFLAGLYARTDVDRGVHKSPANDVIFGALGFEVTVNKFQQELLNPAGVNCLRSFPGRGHRVWGARTLTDDPEWKYVAVRRYFLFLERSIDKATQWAVFEPNGEDLWANIRTTVEGFLFNEWRNGHMLGADPKEAYFVRCDRSTMTQNDLDNGRLVCLIGVAPLRPAEFVIFRVGQKTADAK